MVTGIVIAVLALVLSACTAEGEREQLADPTPEAGAEPEAGAPPPDGGEDDTRRRLPVEIADPGPLPGDQRAGMTAEVYQSVAGECAVEIRYDLELDPGTQVKLVIRRPGMPDSPIAIDADSVTREGIDGPPGEANTNWFWLRLNEQGVYGLFGVIPGEECEVVLGDPQVG